MENKYKHIQVGYGVSTNDNSFSAGKEAAISAIKGIFKHPLSIVLVFASVRYDLSELLDGIKSIVGKIPIIGSTTAGEICNCPYSQSVVVSVLASPYLFVRSGIGKKVSSDWQNAVKEAINSTELKPYFSSNDDIWQKIFRQGKSVFAMTFSPGNTRHANSASFEILEALKQRSNNRIQFFGGCAADDWNMETNYVFHNGEVHSDSLLIVIFETSLKFGIAMAHGFIASDQQAIATKVVGHEVLQFNGSKAADQYAQMLNSSVEELNNKHLTFTSGKPVGILDMLGQYRIIVASFFTDDGAVRFSQPLAENSMLTIMDAQPDKLINAGKEALHKALLRGQIKIPIAAILFSCALRQKILGDLISEEINTIRSSLEDIPILGFYAFGEQGISDAGISCHGNEMISILVFGDELSIQAEVALENQRLLSYKQEHEMFYKNIFNNNHAMMLIINPENGDIVDANSAALSYYGWSLDGLNSKKISDINILPQKEVFYQMQLAIKGEKNFFVFRHRLSNNDIRDVEVSTGPISVQGKKLLFAIIHDITERKRKKKLQSIHMRLIAYAAHHSLQEFIQKCLDEAEAITESEIGFFHFVEDDQKTLSLQTWSTNTLTNRCSASEEKKYLISKAGVWVDCIVERRPVVHNDYMNLPHRKGLPKGHTSIIRELVVPVIRGKKIVAVLGVGNKRANYDDNDVEMIQQLADHEWETVVAKRAEEKTKQSERFLNAIIENIPNMLFVKDVKELRFIRFNKAGEELLGYSRKELIGKNDYDFFPRKEADFFTSKDREVLLSKKLVDIPEEPIQTKAKGERKLHTMKIPLLNENGQPEYLLGISEDITERLKTEKALRENETLLARAQSIAHIGNWNWDIALDLVSWSDELYRILGVSSEFKASYKEYLKCIHPEDVKQFMNLTQKVLKDKKTYTAEYRIIRPNNDIRFVQERGFVMLDAENNPTHLFGTVQDITERKEAEKLIIDAKQNLEEKVAQRTYELNSAKKDLEQNKERLELALKGGNLGFWDINLETDIAIFNERQAEILGYTFEEMPTRCTFWIESVHPDDVGWVLEKEYAFREGNISELEIEYRSITKQGKVVWLVSKGIIVERYQTGNALRMVVTVMDITERKLIELELAKEKKKAERANLAKSEFLANMSHEIRTPMNGIIGMSNLALKTDLNDKQRNYIKKVNRSAEYLLGILNDILDFSKIEAGKMKIEKTDFKLNLVIDNVFNLLNFKAKEKNLNLELNIPSNLPAVLIGDPLRLEQILLNLGDNAIKFTDSGGNVIFSIKIIKQDLSQLLIQFSIQDSGIGISDDQQSKLFQSFSQADTSTTRKYGGTGLGLVISKNLVNIMGGKLLFESKLNVGSKFYFILPFEISTADFDSTNHLITKTESFHDIRKLQGVSILLVEDNDINQELAIDLLNSNGIHVTLAKNGQEALEILEQNSFDGVLMDCQMPVMDGYEATKEIRKQNRYNNLPVIAMTANVMSGDREKALKSGMNDYIAKPINPEEMFATMAKWLSSDQLCSVEKSFHPTNEYSLTEDLPNLKGIDTAAGLSNSQNNSRLYLRLLKKFRDNNINFKKRFRIAQSKNDREALIRIAHTLKSVAGTVGALSIHKAAHALEMACKNNDQLVEQRLKAVITELKPVVTELSVIETLQQNVDKTEASINDKTKIKALIHELFVLVSDDDTQALNVVHQILPLMRHSDQAKIFDDIVSAVERFDFDLAKQLLKSNFSHL